MTSDFAWRSKLRPVKNADQPRELYLDRAQRLKFIQKADEDLAAFLHGLALLPLRPGALAALKTGEYDRRLKVLTIGKDKHGKDRKIKLPDVSAEVLEQVSGDKLPTAPLLSRADGRSGTRMHGNGRSRPPLKWPRSRPGQRPTRCATASSATSSTTGWTCSRSGQISGTSVVMIERHYGHLRSDVASGALARLAL